MKAEVGKECTIRENERDRLVGTKAEVRKKKNFGEKDKKVKKRRGSENNFKQWRKK